MIFYNYDYHGTNKIAINLFTPENLETCPGTLAHECFMGDSYAVMRKDEKKIFKSDQVKGFNL